MLEFRTTKRNLTDDICEVINELQRIEPSQKRETKGII